MANTRLTLSINPALSKSMKLSNIIRLLESSPGAIGLKLASANTNLESSRKCKPAVVIRAMRSSDIRYLFGVQAAGPSGC